MQAYNNSSPTAWMIGEVISESPLLIQIEQRLTIDEDLLARIDAYADDHYITRSGFFSLAADEFLTAVEFKQFMPAFNDLLQKVADGKEISPDDQKKLDGFQAMSDIFTGKLK